MQQPRQGAAAHYALVLDSPDPPVLSERPRLRIAHFIGQCGPKTANGVERAVYELSGAQAGLGHQVARFTLSPPDGDAPAPTPVPGGTPARLVGAATRLLLRRGVPESLLRELVAWRPDIVHLHSLHVPENIMVASRLRRHGIPYCVSAHGAVTPVTKRRSRVRKAVFHALYEQRYLDAAAFVHALTDDERQSLVEHGVRRPITVAPNGVTIRPLVRTDISRASERSALIARLPPGDWKHLFVFVGRLDPAHKGLDLLLRAVADAAIPGLGLVLVGPDWDGDRTGLEALANELGIANSICFLGSLFGDDKLGVLLAADVFVHPSRWEGVSLSVLEAASLGLPSLLTPAADPGGTLGPAGGAVIAEPEPQSLAAALRRLAAMDRPALQQMGAVARRTMEERFSWPVVAESLVSAYRSVTAHG